MIRLENYFCETQEKNKMNNIVLKAAENTHIFSAFMHGLRVPAADPASGKNCRCTLIRTI
jgi:hypothetical protein